jgi:hypothetical protein
MRTVAGVKSHAATVGGAPGAARCRRATLPGARAGLAAVGLALLVSGCAKPYNPFRISRDELRGRIHIIALAPIRVDPDLVDAVPARERIERMATERLSAGGFTVVETKEMERLWREAATDVGDVFDPITGKGDEKRFKLVEDAVYRELGARYRVNAVLYLSVYDVDLFLTGRSVRFCGREDAAYWPGGLGLLEQATLVRAACLGATLYDMEEHVLYTIQSGIEPIETYARQSRAARPRSSRLQDDVRLQRAIDDAVGPLAGTGTK